MSLTDLLLLALLLALGGVAALVWMRSTVRPWTWAPTFLSQAS